MDFSDALKALKEGKKVRYKEMQNNFYLYIQKTDSYKGLIQSIWIYRDKYPTLKWEPDEQELLLDTWEIVQDIPEITISSKLVVCPSCGCTNTYGFYSLDELHNTNGSCWNCNQPYILKVKIPEVNWINLPLCIESSDNMATNKEYTNSKDFHIYFPSLKIDKTLKPGELSIKKVDNNRVCLEF